MKKYYTFEEAKKETGLFHCIGRNGCYLNDPDLGINEDEFIIFIPANKYSEQGENIGIYFSGCSGLEPLEDGWEEFLFVKSDKTISLSLLNE